MHDVDLVATWTWPPDEPVIRLLEAIAHRNGITFRSIDAPSIGPLTADVQQGRLSFRWLLDRASDEHPAFRPLAQWVEDRTNSNARWPLAINPYGRQLHAADKATMHLELMSAGVHVPNTLILPPWSIAPTSSPLPDAVDALGVPFVVKPANTTGGGNGVVTGVKERAQITAARRTHPLDKYLVQETVKPAYLGDFRAWFRVFYVCGRVHLCWWDDRTHIYEPVDPEDERVFGLAALRETASTIARTCGLRFFSTELVMTAEGKIVAVDYVNEMCDLRLQSMVQNGVPDNVVMAILEDIISFVSSPTAGQGVSP